MQHSLHWALRPGVAPGRTAVNTGRVSTHVRSIHSRRPFVAKAVLEAPPAAAKAKLSEKHLQLLQQHKGPLVKIATHYHVRFGDCLKVIGSSKELGAWKAADAPLMKWREGDVWTLLLPLAPGEYEFKVVVQQASGNLVWEAGDANRVVVVPEDAPVDSLITSVCAFNIIDPSAESKLQPVTADVLDLLEEQLEEEAAAEEARLAAEAARAAEEAEKSRVLRAAAAVANAFATMDAEAEESGIRPRTMSDSDTEEAEPQFSTPPRTRAGPAVVAAAVADAPAPVTPAQQEGQTPAVGRFEAAGLRKSGTPAAPAPAGRFEAAGLRQMGSATSAPAAPEAVQEQQKQQEAAVEQQQKQEVVALAAEEMEANLEAMSNEVRGMTDAAVAATSSNPLSPPPITPVGGGSAAFAAASSAMAASAAGVGPSPPPVVSTPSSSQRSVSTQAVAVNGGSNGGAGTMTASGAVGVASAESDALEAEGSPDSNWNEGMQFLASVVGCAAVGTVLWSEFVLKDSGCGLPPGPYGLLGAAEGLSYLTVLGFAGAGIGPRVQSGGKQGLQGPLAVPETLAYGAVAAGLIVLASQLYTYGYIPPPLPGGECFGDSAVAMPENLGAQVAAMQGILYQLQSAAHDGINKLQLQEQLAVLQAQVDAFSGYVSAQADVLDKTVELGLLQLQDSLYNATDSVSSFVDAQVKQLDVSGKLSYVLDILRAQEQQLKVELPRQLAELQQLAATSMAVVQETAIQASGSAHLPELLSSLDNVMAMLHGVLETRIEQLDSVLSQLQGSIGAAAGQLAAAVAAAEQSGSQEAAAQLQGLQGLLSDAMTDVQAQVWAGYQQLALADKLSDMLLSVRTSAHAVATSTAAEVDKLRLQEQLQELEGLAEASASALATNAMDSIHKLRIEERLDSIATQASAAAASLQAGLQQQYAKTVPAMQAQMSSLQASLADFAAKSDKQVGGSGVELDSLLRQLQQSMDSTMKLVGEVASSGVEAAGDAVQGAGQSATSGLTAVSQQLGAATDAVSTGLASSFPDAVAPTAVSAVAASSAVVDVAAPTAVSASSAVVDVAAPLVAAVQGGGVAEMAAPLATTMQASAPAASSATVDAAAVTEAATKGAMAVSLSAASDFVVDHDAVAAAYAEAVEAGLDFSKLVAYALPDAHETLQSLPNAQTYKVDGVDLTEASDLAKQIWFNRPQ